jgi:two-component system, OmpR family, KDP operon response regulator KdpE
VTDPQCLVLVVEDEPQMRRFLRTCLVAHDYRLLEAETGLEAVRLTTSHNPDLILLDLGLPDVDGIDLARQIRGWSHVPIIVISARGREDDKVVALDAGADDYLTKPFGVRELLARIRAAMRRVKSADAVPLADVLEFGALRLDRVRREVAVAGQPVHLTPIEYKLLVLLAENAGRVLTHRQILKHVWGAAYSEHPHYVRVHMAELRKKVEPDRSASKLIVTEPGVGYRLRDVPPSGTQTPP